MAKWNGIAGIRREMFVVARYALWARGYLSGVASGEIIVCGVSCISKKSIYEIKAKYINVSQLLHWRGAQSNNIGVNIKYYMSWRGAEEREIINAALLKWLVKMADQACVKCG
jgi:hypothetical protein